MFEPQSSVYQVNQITSGSVSALFGRQVSKPDTWSGMMYSPIKKTQISPTNVLKRESSVSCTLASLKRSFSSAFSKDCDSGTSTHREVNKQRKLDAFLNKTVQDPQDYHGSENNCSSLMKGSTSEKAIEKQRGLPLEGNQL